MATVWVVEEGSYSDYRVVGVFSTKENAEKVASLIGGSVGEWPLDPHMDEINQGRFPFRVMMEKSGDIVMVEQESWYSFPINTEIRLEMGYKNIPRRIAGIVFATDETHAIKIINEHRARFIAEGRWAE